MLRRLNPFLSYSPLLTLTPDILSRDMTPGFRAPDISLGFLFFVVEQLLTSKSSVMLGVNVNASTANNNRGLSVPIDFGTGVWPLLAIPWSLKEKRRSGREIPPGMK